MTFTYDPALPSVKDEMRLELGDTDLEAVLLQDETYTAVYARHATAPTTLTRYHRTIRDLGRAILAQVARQPVVIDVSGAVKVDYRERIPLWQELVARYAALTGDLGAISGQYLSGTISYVGTTAPTSEE